MSDTDMAFPSHRTEAARLRRSRTRLLAMAAMRSDRRVNEALASVDARKWHYAVLATLDEFGPASQADLSGRTGIYRSDLVAVITELAARDLVDRSPNPTDRRQNVITITKPGHRHLLTLDKLLATAEADFLSPLTPAERDQLTTLLTALVER
jgi:DNA-binding MarR family transcriptional regulator